MIFALGCIRRQMSAAKPVVIYARRKARQGSYVRISLLFHCFARHLNLTSERPFGLHAVQSAGVDLWFELRYPHVLVQLSMLKFRNYGQSLFLQLCSDYF